MDDFIDWDDPEPEEIEEVKRQRSKPKQQPKSSGKKSSPPPESAPTREGNSMMPIAIAAGAVGAVAILIIALIIGLALMSGGVMNQPPVADLEASSTNVQTYESITLDATGSSDSDGSIVYYSWDLNGDGIADDGYTNDTVTTTFKDDGSYTVWMWVEDDSGDSASDSVTIEVSNRAPMPQIIASATIANTKTTISFDPSVDDMDGSIVKAEWDMDGDGTFEKEANTYTARMERSFDDDGSYPVSLKVTDDDGATATTTVNLTILNQAPSGTISGPTDDCLTFDNVTIEIEATDVDGTIGTYLWDHDGDGVVDETTSVPTMTTYFSEPGSYTIKCDVVDDDGAAGIFSHDVTILNRAPVASIQANGLTGAVEVLTSTSIGFEPVANDVDGAIASFEWDIDADGTYEALSGQPDTFYGSFSDDGLYTVKLRVTDDEGAETEASCLVTVNNRPPVVTAQVESKHVYTLTEINLTADATDSDGTISYYQWDLNGDGAYDTNKLGSPEYKHTFYQDGTVDITLRVVDDDGDEGLSTITMTIMNSPPKLSVTPSATDATNVDEIEFDVTCTDDDGQVVNFEWDFDGDGTVDLTTTQFTTTHLYDTAGSYNCKIKAYDDDGAYTTRTITINIIGNRAPVAEAGDDLSFDMGTNVSLDGSSSYDPDGHDIRVKWDFTTDGTWDFDSESSTIANYEYPNPGVFTATIWVSDGHRESTDTTEVTILSTEKKWAVCIGISDYPGSGSDLYYCDDDAYDWKNYLEGKGYTVHTLIDSEATQNGVQTEVAWLKANAAAGDTVVFTYSGHGIYSGGDSQMNLYDSTRSATWLSNQFSGLNFAKRFLFFDCCNSGSFGDEFPDANTYTAQACRTYEYSLDDPSLQNGGFTWSFLTSGLVGHPTYSTEQAFTTAYNYCSTMYGGQSYHPVEDDGNSGEAFYL